MNHVLSIRYPWATNPPSTEDLCMENRDGFYDGFYDASRLPPEDLDDDPIQPQAWESAREKLRIAKRRERKRAHAHRELRIGVGRYHDQSICKKVIKNYVGQPWKACLHALLRIFPHHTSQKPLFRDIDRHIARQVLLLDEIPHHIHRFNPVACDHYVCPLTGNVKRVFSLRHGLNTDVTKKRRRHAIPRPIKVSDTEQHRWMRSSSEPGRWAWHLVEFAPIPPRDLWTQTVDVVLQKTLAQLDHTDCVPYLLHATLLVKDVFARAARPLTPNELFSHGLSRRRPGDTKNAFDFHR